MGEMLQKPAIAGVVGRLQYSTRKPTFPTTPADGRADREADIRTGLFDHAARARPCRRSRCRSRGRPISTGQSDRELGELADAAVDLDRTTVLLGHDVIADREAEPGALAGRLGREERLEQLIPDFVRNADAVVSHRDLDRVTEVAGRHRKGRMEVRLGTLALPLGGGVEAIADQVQEYAGNLLRHQLDRLQQDRKSTRLN